MTKSSEGVFAWKIFFQLYIVAPNTVARSLNTKEWNGRESRCCNRSSALWSIIASHRLVSAECAYVCTMWPHSRIFSVPLAAVSRNTFSRRSANDILYIFHNLLFLHLFYRTHFRWCAQPNATQPKSKVQTIEEGRKTRAPWPHVRSIHPYSLLLAARIDKNVGTSTSCSLALSLDPIQLSFLLFGSFSCLQWQKWIRACNFDPLEMEWPLSAHPYDNEDERAHVYAAPFGESFRFGSDRRFLLTNSKFVLNKIRRSHSEAHPNWMSWSVVYFIFVDIINWHKETPRWRRISAQILGFFCAFFVFQSSRSSPHAKVYVPNSLSYCVLLIGDGLILLQVTQFTLDGLWAPEKRFGRLFLRPNAAINKQ